MAHNLGIGQVRRVANIVYCVNHCAFVAVGLCICYCILVLRKVSAGAFAAKTSYCAKLYRSIKAKLLMCVGKCHVFSPYVNYNIHNPRALQYGK